MSIFLLLLLLLFEGTIKTSSANFCNVWSFYDYNKPSEPFYCADNMNCILNCFGQYSCFGAIIYGPKNAELTIKCDSSQDIDGPNSEYSSSFACTNMSIYAQHSTKLYINIYNNPNEFRDNTIYTPYDANADIPEQYVYNSYINCGIFGTLTKINEVINNCGANNNIYSVYGWPTVQWSYAGQAAWSLNVKPYLGGENFTIMHCGVNFEDSCITPWYSYYYCNDQQSVCNSLPSSKMPTISTTSLSTTETTVRTCEPTTKPTITQTTASSNPPSDTPTIAQTTASTNSPSDTPTMAPVPTTTSIQDCLHCDSSGGIAHCVRVTAVIVFICFCIVFSL